MGFLLLALGLGSVAFGVTLWLRPFAFDHRWYRWLFAPKRDASLRGRRFGAASTITSGVVLSVIGVVAVLGPLEIETPGPVSGVWFAAGLGVFSLSASPPVERIKKKHHLRFPIAMAFGFTWGLLLGLAIRWGDNPLPFGIAWGVLHTVSFALGEGLRPLLLGDPQTDEPPADAVVVQCQRCRASIREGSAICWACGEVQFTRGH